MTLKKTTSNKNLLEFEQILNELCSTSMGRRAFLGSVGFLLASCASQTSHRNREGDNSGQETELSVSDEVKMTQEVLPQMRKDYPLMQNSEVQSYVADLGARVVRSNNLEGNPYRYSFAAVDVDYVNAFALPAGTVFVTAPLIALAENEAELSGVIGHEVGHIKARHTAERMDKAKKSEKKSILYTAGGGLLGGALGYGAGKLLCKQGDNECMQRAALYGAAAGAGGALLVQKYAFMANSREDEMEADRIGFRTSVGANYHKDHVGSFYAKLLKMEEEAKGKQGGGIMTSLADALSTHPPSRERVNQMNQMSQEEKLNPLAVVNTSQFDRMKKICEEHLRLRKNSAKS